MSPAAARSSANRRLRLTRGVLLHVHPLRLEDSRAFAGSPPDCGCAVPFHRVIQPPPTTRSS